MVFLAVGPLLALARRRITNANSEATVSIAVLPFANLANDPDLDYLADGLAESLTNSLARIPRLKVSARATAFRYKGQDGDIRKVGHELGVQALSQEGSHEDARTGCASRPTSAPPMLRVKSGASSSKGTTRSFAD